MPQTLNVSVPINIPEKYIWTANLQVQGQDKNTVVNRYGIKGNPNRVVISDGTIGKWDSSMPRADTLRKVADYLGVTTAYILDRAKEK